MKMRKTYRNRNRQEVEQRVGLLSNNMEARSEHQETRRFNLFYGVTTALGALLVVLVIIWASYFRGGFTWTSDPKIQFNWHPVLMIISLVFLYSQSMLIYRSQRNMPKKKLKLIHASLHSLAFVLAVVGLQAAFDSHNLAKDPIPNLYTLHSWIGIITVVLFAYQLLIGFIAFLYPGLAQEIRAALLPVHTSVGIGTFTLAIISATSGFLEKAIFALDVKYKERSSESWMINFMGLILVAFGLLVHYLVNEHSYKRKSQPEDQMVLSESPDESSSVIPKDN